MPGLVVIALLFCASASKVRAQSGGAVWRYLGPDGANIISLAAWKDTLYAASPSNGVFRSTDGFRWQRINGIWANFYSGLAVGATSGNITVVFPFGSIGCYEDVRTGRRILQSKDGGQTWQTSWISSNTTPQQIVPQYIPSLNPASAQTIKQQQQPFVQRAFTFSTVLEVYAVSQDSLYYSSNAGTSWKTLGIAPKTQQINGLARAFDELYVASEQGVFRSADNGKSWQLVNNGLSSRSIDRVMANDSVAVAILGDNTAHIVRNEVLELFPDINNEKSSVAGVTPVFLYAQAGGSLWRSRNGAQWQRVGSPQFTINALSMGQGEHELFAATSNGVYRSQDSAQTWQQIGLQGVSSRLILATQNTVYVASGDKVSVLTQDGATWQSSSVSSGIQNIQNFVEYQGVIYVEGYYSFECEFVIGRVFRTDNRYNIEFLFSWLAAAITARQGEILRGYAKNGLLERSTDNGKTWKILNTDRLATQDIRSLAANKKSIFVGTSGGLYVLDAPTTSVSVRETPLFTGDWSILAYPPENRFALHITLPAPTHVRCTLHNVLGQEIATLADNAYASGQHEIAATAPNLASGLYICRLVMDGRVVGSKSVVIAH